MVLLCFRMLFNRKKWINAFGLRFLLAAWARLAFCAESSHSPAGGMFSKRAQPCWRFDREWIEGHTKTGLG
jgi:hypothetical protein